MDLNIPVIKFFCFAQKPLVTISRTSRSLWETCFFGTTIHACFLDCGTKPENPENMQTPHKRVPGPGPSSCEAPALITAPPCCIFGTKGIDKEAGIPWDYLQVRPQPSDNKKKTWQQQREQFTSSVSKWKKQTGFAFLLWNTTMVRQNTDRLKSVGKGYRDTCCHI